MHIATLEATIGLFGTSAGEAGTGGLATVDSSSNITVSNTSLGANSLIGGFVEGRNQNLSLVSGIDAKNNGVNTGAVMPHV